MQPVYFNFQGNAPLAVLSFLGLGFLEVVAVAAVIVLFAKGRARLARRILAGALAAGGLYLALLLGLSLTSREQVADRGAEKYFCEVDCHLAYSVVGVTGSKTLGTGSRRSTAQGTYRVVTLNIRFDENTISSHRVRDAPLTPNSRFARVVDASGDSYLPDSRGERALASVEGPAIPLRSLRPGESCTSRLVFDLPDGLREPRLLITEADWVTRFLIGHENSFFHKKTSFSLS